MNSVFGDLALDAFRNASRRVPAYQILLREHGIQREEITDLEQFLRLPILEKKDTFQRFPLGQLCLDGLLGDLGSVLTSSGHSGVFAFGLTERGSHPDTVQWIDAMLDMIFQVRTRATLLINCLPMGVKVHSNICTLAETSVRPDMVIALLKKFGEQFQQFIVIGDAAFVKHVLELGEDVGVDWSRLLVHVILGEELLAENARKYIERLLGRNSDRGEKGLVCSSMGVGEVGLNLFSEVPPVAPLIALRRVFHEDWDLRAAVFGDTTWLPSLFTYDPGRIFVEFDPLGRLVLTTLQQNLRLPLIRYATGDQGQILCIPEHLRGRIERMGLPWSLFAEVPIVAISGRGRHVVVGTEKVYPEAVKEGVYYDPDLARLTTANFRLKGGSEKGQIRIQLSPDVPCADDLASRFRPVIARYVTAPMEIICEPYASFGSGMALDYERKFDYLGA
jgi:phenylacetate-CoA ligase